MASFNGRPGPNVADYIANLNVLPDMTQQDPDLGFADDLAAFTNTEFYDFDSGLMTNLEAPSEQHISSTQQHLSPAQQPPLAAPAVSSDLKNLDFINDFAFPDFSFPQQPAFHSEGVPSMPHGLANQSMYAVSSTGSSPSPDATYAGEKRKADSISGMSSEEASRIAAEEDKRRRNTAASARFRVKKKQREAALERSAKEMSDKVSALESRINQLETENKWLKNLITEKNENKDDIASLWRKYSQEAGDRKGSERKDGVGTDKA